MQIGQRALTLGARWESAGAVAKPLISSIHDLRSQRGDSSPLVVWEVDYSQVPPRLGKAAVLLCCGFVDDVFIRVIAVPLSFTCGACLLGPSFSPFLEILLAVEL
ncbi:hypothetical protein AALO_G00036080 [Alosa alosa]|uniref:Uncharacterized protein n=1 Tax=Alosa alosa TaxID=278164 RepID=A0AAV6H6T7_9TELE|nr:hypothetical protein AALO_G00036080 [Alosa alosa]